MAFDAEEFRQRRAQREQQRAQQQAARRKRMVVKLIVAAVVLAVCGAVIFAVARSGKEPSIQQTQPTVSIPTYPTQKPEKITKIHLAAAGDLNINDAVVAAGGMNGDYTNAFMDIAHLLADADVSMVNFEGVLCGAPYGDSKSAPQGLVTELSKMGVDLIQMANSYSIYKGVSGLATTIANIRAAGMEPLGVYANREQYEEGKGYVLCNVQGVKIAFVSFTKGMDGMALPAGSENCVNVLYTDYASTYQTVNEKGIKAVLQAAEAEKPDITVALLHWGSEFNDTLSSSQKQIRNILLENGVDAIIGTHSHYVQKMEFEKDDNTFVAYSLGDFFGDAQRAGTEYSVILDLEITKDNETGKTTITDYSYIPIFTVAEKNKPLRVVRIHEAMAAYEAGYIDRVSKETYDAMKYALQRIEARVAGE